MVVRTSFDLRGLDEYLEAVARAGNDVDEAVAEALAESGDTILGEMQMLVPIGETGNLFRALIRTDPEREGNYTFIEVGMQNKEQALAAGYSEKMLADVARYGNAQEYGYRRGGKFYTPRSYIRAGFDKSLARARRVQRDVLRRWGMVD